MKSAATNAAFVLNGIATTMVGSLLPALQSRWQLNDARAGLLFPAQFVASATGTLLIGWLARRRGYFALLPIGMLLIGAGAAGLAILDWPAGLAAIACYGLGFGIVTPAGNLAVAEMFPGASARPLTYLNLSWSAGAMTAPLLVAMLPGSFLAGFSVAAVAMAGALAKIARGSRAPDRGATGRPKWIAAAMLFLYVGAEAAVYGWIPTRAERGFGANSMWVATSSIFWAAILAGRVVTPAVLRRFRLRSVLIWSTAAALVGSVTMVADPRPESLLPGAVLAGLGMAPVFPLIVSQYAGGRTPGLLFAMGGLGGALLPLLVGYVSSETHSLRLGMSLIPVALAVLLWLEVRDRIE